MAARARSLCCFVSPARSDVVKPRRGSAACICCIGPHHKPSSGAGAGAGAGGLGPDADVSARSPLISCCGSGDNVRGRSTTRTPPTASRRLCGGVRSRTPRRGHGHGQACCFPAAAATDTAAPASARAVVPARTTPRTPTTTPLGARRQQRACCVVRGPAQKLGRRRSWFRSARQQAVAQQTPRFPDRDSARGGDSGVKVHDARLAEVEARAATKKQEEEEAETETCSNDEYAQLCREGFSREDVAAVTIQAYFRGHLARRASKALKSLVRLQAVARGANVRRQAEVAMRCMQAMVRLQVRVRAARQMITTNGTKPKPKEKDGQLLLQS